MNKTIYYFSATGNSLQAALDIGEGIGAEVASVAKAGMKAKCDSEVIGFVFPSFCWGAPNMMYDFISSGNFNPNAYFFAVVTCGAQIGVSAYDVDGLLRAKGAKLSYCTKLKMVSNYIPMYDVNVATIDEVLKTAESELVGIIADINAQKVCEFKKKFRLISKIRIKIMKSYKKADEKYIVNDSCTGCGICASVCPAKNIELKEGKPEFQHRCEHCIACIHWCPQKAIDYGKSTQKRNRYHHPKVKAEQLP